MSISGWSSEGVTLPTSKAQYVPGSGPAPLPSFTQAKASTLPLLHSADRSNIKQTTSTTMSSTARTHQKPPLAAKHDSQSARIVPIIGTNGGGDDAVVSSPVLRVAPQPPSISPRKGVSKPSRMVPIPPSTLKNLSPSNPTKDQAANNLVSALMKTLRTPKQPRSQVQNEGVGSSAPPPPSSSVVGGASEGRLVLSSRSLASRGDDSNEDDEPNEVELLSTVALENGAKNRQRTLRNERLQTPLDFSQFIAAFCSSPKSGTSPMKPATTQALTPYSTSLSATSNTEKKKKIPDAVSVSALKSRVEGFGKVLEDISALMPDYVSTFLHAKRFNAELFAILKEERVSNSASEEAIRQRVEEEQRSFYEGKLVELLQDRRKLTHHIISLNSEITSLKTSRDEELRHVKKNVFDTLEKFSREDATGNLQRAMTTQAFQTNIALMDRVHNLCAFIRTSGLPVPGSAQQYDAVKKDIMFGKKASSLPTLGSYIESNNKRRSTRRITTTSGSGESTGDHDDDHVADSEEMMDDDTTSQHRNTRGLHDPIDGTIKVEDQVGPQFIEASKREVDQCRLSNQQMLISTASDSHKTYRLLLGHKDTEIETLKVEVRALNDKIASLQKQIDDQHFDMFKQQQTTMNLIQQGGGGGSVATKKRGSLGGELGRVDGQHHTPGAAPLKVSQTSDANNVLIKRHFTALSVQVLSSAGKTTQQPVTTTDGSTLNSPTKDGGVTPTTTPAYDPLRPSTPRPWVPFTVQSALGVNIRQPTAALVHELATVALNYKAELEEVHVARKKLVAQLSYVDSLAFPPPDHPNDPPFIPTISEDTWASIPHFLRTRVTPHVNNSVWSQEYTAHLVRKFFEGFEMYSELSVFRRDHKMVEPRSVLIKDRRKHIMQAFDISQRQINDAMDRAQQKELHESGSFMASDGGSNGGLNSNNHNRRGGGGGLTMDMLTMDASHSPPPMMHDDHLLSGDIDGGAASRPVAKPTPTDTMLHAAMAAMPLGYVVSTFLLYEMQDKMYKHRLIPIGVRGTYQHNREDFAVESEFTKLAYNLWHSVRKFRQAEPLCDMFMRVVEGEVPANIYEHSQNAITVLQWRLAAQDPSGSGLVTFPQITSAILSVAAEQPIGVWKQLLFAVNQTMKDNHVPLHGKIPISTLFATENNHHNVGDRPNAVTIASQIAGSSLLVKSLRRIVTHKFCDLYAIIEALLLPLVRESSLVPGMAVLRVPHAIQRLRQFEEEYSSMEYADAVQYGLSILASRSPQAGGKLASATESLNTTYRPPVSHTTLPSQYASSTAQQFELMDARDVALGDAKGAPASTIGVNALSPSAMGSLSQYLCGNGLLDSGGGGSSFPFFATHKHPITIGDVGSHPGDSLPPPSMFGNGTTHADGASAAVPYVPTTTFFHCEIARLFEEMADTLPRMNASMHLLEEAVKNTRKKRRRSLKGRRSQPGGGSVGGGGDIVIPIVEGGSGGGGPPGEVDPSRSVRRGTMQPGDRTSVSTSASTMNFSHPTTPGTANSEQQHHPSHQPHATPPRGARHAPVKRVTAVSVANAKDDQELVEWYGFLRLLRTYIRPMSFTKADTPDESNVDDDVFAAASQMSRSGAAPPTSSSTPQPGGASVRQSAPTYTLGKPFLKDLLFREVPHLEDMLATHVAAKKRGAGTSIGVGSPPTTTTTIYNDNDNDTSANNTNSVLGEIVKERQGGPTLSGAHTPFSTYGGSMSPPGRRSATPEGDDDR